jgi:hypothetical protein
MRSFVPLFGAALIGCTAPAPASPPMPLSAPLAISARGAMPSSRVSFVASGGFARQPSEQVIALQDLKLLVDSGDHPRIQQLEMPLGNIDVPAEALPPSGLKLRDLKLSLVEPLHPMLVHAQDDALELEVTTPIQLDWSMVLADGTTYPLGPARTKPVRVAIDVVRDGDAVIATVNAHCSGACWSIDGVAELRDASLYAEGQAHLAPQ